MTAVSCLNCAVSDSNFFRVAAICAGSDVAGWFDDFASLLDQAFQRIAQWGVELISGVTQLCGLRNQLIDVAHVAHLSEEDGRLPEQTGALRAAGLRSLDCRRRRTLGDRKHLGH